MRAGGPGCVSAALHRLAEALWLAAPVFFDKLGAVQLQGACFSATWLTASPPLSSRPRLRLCCRKTVGIYAGVGVLSGLMVCLHKVRGNL